MVVERSSAKTEVRVMEMATAARGAGLHQVTERDLDLFRLLVLARYFSTEQIGRLFFPGRAERTVRRRLAKLAGIGNAEGRRPYLRQHPYYTADGDVATAWSLTPMAYERAQPVPGAVRFPR